MTDTAFTAWPRRAADRMVLSRGARALHSGLRFLLRHSMVALGLLSGCVAALLAAGMLTIPLPPRPAPALPRAKAAPPAWVDVVKPIEIFSLETGDFARLAKTYKARRHVSGGGREDAMTWGAPGPEPLLRLSLYRRGAEDYAAAPFFVDVTRQAADLGLSVTHSSLPSVLPTRFGPFQIADVSLGDASAVVLPCSGYRLTLASPALTITGLACGGHAALSHDRLRCFIERLDLTSGASDKPLVDFFAASELKRNGGCAGMRLGPDESHAGWLDDRSATPRKITRKR